MRKCNYTDILLVFSFILLLIIIVFLLYNIYKDKFENFTSLNAKYPINVKRNDRHILIICFCKFSSIINYKNVDVEYRNHILYEYYNDLVYNKYFNARTIGPIFIPTLLSDAISLNDNYNPEKASKIIVLLNNNLNTDTMFNINNNRDLGFNNVDIIKDNFVDNDINEVYTQKVVDKLVEYDSIFNNIYDNYTVFNTFLISNNDDITTRNTKYDNFIRNIDDIITQIDNLNDDINANKPEDSNSFRFITNLSELPEPVASSTDTNNNETVDDTTPSFNPPPIITNNKISTEVKKIINSRNRITMTTPSYAKSNNDIFNFVLKNNPAFYLTV